MLKLWEDRLAAAAKGFISASIAAFSLAGACSSFSRRPAPALSNAAAGSGCTATAVSPSIVSGRVVATITWSGSPGLAIFTHRVLDVPEVALHGFVEHFVIAHGRLQERVPIHEPLAAIDFAVLEQVEEPLAHGTRIVLVERELRAVPIATAAHLLELRQDAGLVLVLPVPNPLHQPLAAQVVPRFLFFFKQPPLDHRLRGDAGMVGARHPQRVEALHALHANEDVLQRVVERVAEVQRTGHIRRRDHDREHRPRIVGLGVEVAALFPEGIPLLLAPRRDRIGKEGV